MSAFFGARAPELVPEHVMDLPLKPASRASLKKLPLHERSLSDLNASNNGKPTIRLVQADNDDSSTYNKTPSKKARSTSPTKQRDSIYVDDSAAGQRPQSRDGALTTGPRPYIPKKSANRISVLSTATSDADTLVNESIRSPVRPRFEVEMTSRGQPLPMGDAFPDHLSALAEQSSSVPEMATSDLPDIPELPSSDYRPRHMAHSSSVYSSATFDDLARSESRHLRRRSNSSGVGFAVAPIEEASEESEIPSSPPPTESSDPPTERDRSTSHIIRYVNSNDSFAPQYPTMRPALHNVPSMNSMWSAESAGMVEPLHVPRKRAHMYTASLNSYPSLNRMQTSHLSTIASETEGTDSNWQLAGANFPRRRRTVSSAYEGATTSSQSQPEIKAASSDESMSAALHSDSAIPAPLFSSSAPIPQRPFNRSSTLHTDEVDDTIGELPMPQLREKRSGYIVRQRSRSDLRPSTRGSNHSVAESDRWSTGSIIFPQWAKSFYGGKAALASANVSRVTLAGPPYGASGMANMTLAGPEYGMINASTRSFDLSRPVLRHQHSRTETIGTWATRPESSHSNWETIYTESPASRIFGAFRSRSRPRSHTDRPVSSIRRDSMSIMTAPASPDPSASLAPPQTNTTRISLKSPLRLHPTGPKPHPPARKPSTRPRHRSISTAPPAPWMQSFVSIPHLAQNARLQRVLSAWRVPSIDEPFPADMFGRGNRQIVCFCLGFMLPPLWIIAAFLPLPHCA